MNTLPRTVMQEVEQAIRSSWTIDTSSRPDQWSEDNRARGQCVPSALVMQDYFGGTLKRYQTSYLGEPETHYVNLLDPDGEEVDVTKFQYPEGFQKVASESDLQDYKSIREKLLADPSTAHRYELLRASVKRLLPKEIT